MSKPNGITVRHRDGCAILRGGKRCRCQPTYQARVGSRADRATKTFSTLAEAAAWRDMMLRKLRAGERVTPERGPRLWDAARRFILDAEVGEALTRSAERYKPSSVRSYHESLRAHVTGPLVRGDLRDHEDPQGPPSAMPLAAKRLGEVTRADVRHLLASLDGASRQTKRNLRNALAATYRYAVAVGSYAEDAPVPTRGITVTGRAPDRSKRRPISAGDAERLICALPSALDRAVWSTAFYAGLRCGELRALRWEDVSLGEWRIGVRRSWDRREGAQAVKSTAGERVVPLAGRLRDRLLDLPGRDGLVFGENASPFSEWALYARADRAWKATGLDRVTLHQARHTAGLIWRVAGVDLKDLSLMLGHASIQQTLDQYGWPSPNHVEVSRGLLDAYLS